MTVFRVETTPEQDKALAVAAGDADPGEYLTARVNDILNDYMRQFNTVTVVMSTDDLAAARDEGKPWAMDVEAGLMNNAELTTAFK